MAAHVLPSSLPPSPCPRAATCITFLLRFERFGGAARYRGLRIAKVKLTRRQLVRAGIRSCGIAVFSLSLSDASQFEDRRFLFFFYWKRNSDGFPRCGGEGRDDQRRLCKAGGRAPIPPSRLFATLVVVRYARGDGIPAPFNRDFSFGGERKHILGARRRRIYPRIIRRGLDKLLAFSRSL